MQKFDNLYNRIILGNIDKIALGTVMILIVGFSYSIHFLFNRPVDIKIEQQIQQKYTSANIKFDEETIKNITESKNYGTILNPSTKGKNPFTTY